MKSFSIEQTKELFFSKVKKTDSCWEWIACLNRQGYGNFRSRTFFPNDVLAHRISWIMENGPIQDGMYVLHACDNPKCVRPDHLFLGTQADNMKDLSKKGRHPRNAGGYLPNGESHHLYNNGMKITRQQAMDIRSDIAPHAQIAQKFGISTSMVYRIKSGRNWK